MYLLVNLTNLLICEALAELLKQAGEGYKVVASVNAEDVANITPNQIIVDSKSLKPALAERWPNAKIVLIDTGLDEDEILSLLLNYRLDGIIKPDCDIQFFKKALTAVGHGQIWIDNSRIKSLLKHAESLAGSQNQSNLSKKEKEIILLIAKGQKNREIAGELKISEQTVKSHISRIFRKKNLNCRSQLVPLAMKLKLPVLE